MNYLTDFADQAVVLPLAVCVLAALLALGWRRGAFAWGAAVAGVLGLMLLLKLVTMACSPHLRWTGLSSPSGHTACAAVVYGGLLALLAPSSRAGTWAAALAGGAAALLFALTRLALQVHTVPDVLVGAAVGVAGTVAMRWMAGPRPPRRFAPWLLLAVAGVALAFHGDRLEAESRLRWLALAYWPLDRCQ